jgi:exopolysaccharide production protein ExoQ
VIVSTLPNGPTALRYLCIGYFMGCIVLFARHTLPTFLRGWPTLLIPALCVLSATWAPSSSEAIRKGVFMFLTAAVAVHAASRLTTRDILVIYFAGIFITAVMSVLQPNVIGGNWTGVFGQKNYLATFMFILFVVSFGLALDAGTVRWVRFAAMLGIPLSAGLIYLSHSATTLVMTMLAAMAFLGHAFVWQPASRIPHMRAFLVLAIVLLATIAALIVFGLFQLDAVEAVLTALGKDSTLTGRTFLWSIADRIIEEHPLTGVGANGFWRPELGAANEITRYFFYENYVRFSFHNSYREIGTQLGYPGMVSAILVAVWALWSNVRTWMRNQTILNITFVVLAIAVVMRANTEIDLVLEFTGTTVLMFIGAFRKERLPPRWAPVEPPAPSLMQPPPGPPPERRAQP